MPKSKNAFTLIEMLVVIFIITIILMITMSFSGDRIQQLNNKNTQEEFMTAYDEQYLIVSNSNYIDGERYNQLQISFKKDGTDFSYQYIGSDSQKKIMIKSGTNNVLGKIKVKEICMQGKKLQSLNIKLTPYQLGCTLNDTEGEAIIKIGVNNDREEKCFKISSQLGRLISMKECPSVCTVSTVFADDMENVSDEIVDEK